MWDWISKNLVWIIPIAGIIITIIGRIIKFVHLWNKNKTNKEALEIEKNKAKSLEENTIISLAKLGLNLEEKRKVDLGLPLEIERIHAYFPESNECDLSNKDGSFSRELIVSLKLINNSNNSIIIKDIFISDDNPLIFKENACTFESFKDKMRSLTNKIGSLFMENEQEYIEKMYDDESYVLHLEFIGTELNPILRENPTAKRTEEKHLCFYGSCKKALEQSCVLLKIINIRPKKQHINYTILDLHFLCNEPYNEPKITLHIHHTSANDHNETVHIKYSLDIPPIK